MNAADKRAIQAAVATWCKAPEFRIVARYVDSAKAGHYDPAEVINEVTAAIRDGLIIRLQANVNVPANVME